MGRVGRRRCQGVRAHCCWGPPGFRCGCSSATWGRCCSGAAARHTIKLREVACFLKLNAHWCYSFFIESILKAQCMDFFFVEILNYVML